jgi:TRAP-type C4-dicarboxylate transport system permease small subunit
MGFWPRINHFLNKLEEALLVFLLALMVLLAFLPILFRNVVSIGLIWSDPLLRHLVLWVALLGASLATREGRHIKIDLLTPYLGPGKQAVLSAGLHFFSAAVCLTLVLPAVEFVREERELAKYLIGVIPLWVSQAIIPVMLTVIGLRFGFAAWRNLRQRKQS